MPESTTDKKKKKDAPDFCCVLLACRILQLDRCTRERCSRTHVTKCSPVQSPWYQREFKKKKNPQKYFINLYYTNTCAITQTCILFWINLKTIPSSYSILIKLYSGKNTHLFSAVFCFIRIKLLSRISFLFWDYILFWESKPHSVRLPSSVLYSDRTLLFSLIVLVYDSIFHTISRFW